jgi:hypothetical protein
MKKSDDFIAYILKKSPSIPAINIAGISSDFL